MTELQFDSKIEERYIIGYLIKDPSMFLRMGGYLKTNDYLKNSKFIDNKLQWLLNIVCKYNERFGKFPSETELTILADKQFKEDETLCGLFKKTVKEICNIDLSEVSKDYIQERTISFIKADRAVMATYLNQVDIENGKFEELDKRMRDAVNINFDKDLGISIKDVKQTIDFIQDEEDLSKAMSIADSTTLDYYVRPLPGEVVCFSGVPGAGKTLWMGNTAIKAFKDNKKAIIFSLETSAKRLVTRVYQAMFNKTKSQLMGAEGNEVDSMNVLAQTCPDGDIIIKNFQANAASANDMASVLNDLKTYNNWEPDIIIVDYIGIMATNNKASKNDNSYGYCKIVTEELRNLAVQFNCPVVTACQINRDGMGNEGGSKNLVTSKNIAESRGILDTVDYMITINETSGEKYTNKEHTEGKYRLYVDKNRNGEVGAIIPFKINWTTLALSEIKE